MTFAAAVDKSAKNKKTTTTNGMPMRTSSKNYVLDLFFNIGAMRLWSPQEKISAFEKAFAENEDLTTRVLLWSRDIRGGAGERETFRTVVRHLCITNYELAERIANRISELGRWDDLLIYLNTPAEMSALKLIAEGLHNGDSLCAKWMPRHKPFKKKIKKITEATDSIKDIEFAAKHINEHNATVAKIRNFLGLDAKQYRKLLSSLSSTVEQQMCDKKWSEINYSHVPSIASINYRKAFNRNDEERYQEYLNALTKGDPEVKVNADAIFPHDVIKPIFSLYGTASTTDSEKQLVEAQWSALPDYMDDTKVLPMVDSSGSMGISLGGNITAMQIAFSLGMYISEKNKGSFKDLILTFSSDPTLMKLEGDLTSKMYQLRNANWGMSTNIEKAFIEVLNVSVQNKVPQEEMPEVLLILSDMQFNSAVRDSRQTISKTLKKEYSKAGYKVPKVVFWNLNAHGTVPVKMDKSGAALVSGFSPAILKSILSSIKDFTPEAIMLKAIMNERYNY